MKCRWVELPVLDNTPQGHNISGTGSKDDIVPGTANIVQAQFLLVRTAVPQYIECLERPIYSTYMHCSSYEYVY